MGFHSAFFDEPDQDFYQLSESSDFRLILQAKDPGIEVWNDHGSAFMTNGESFYVGPPFFDTHPVWNIVSGDFTNIYRLTFIVRDLNGVYPETQPFQVAFTAVKPALLSLESNGSGGVTISGQGSPDFNYISEAAGSANGPWTVISTNTADAGGLWSFTEAATSTERFYRAFVR